MSKRWFWIAVIFATAMPSLASAATPIGACRTTISVQGSYVLSGNLTNPDNAAPCITVTEARVSIDLAGYTITGAGGSVGIADSQPFLTITGGTITGFQIGIQAGLNTRNVMGIKLSKVRVNASGYGAQIGPYSQVTDSEFSGNEYSGLQTESFSLVKRNRFIANGNADGHGLDAAFCIVSDNVFHDNTGDAITAGAVSLVSGNLVTSNSGTGIVAYASLVTNNNSSLNSIGFYIEGYSSIQNNLAFGNSSGIQLDCPDLAIGNTARGNSINFSPNGEGCVYANNLMWWW